ncbi:MAG: 3-hydroxybutyryl-CoA dehydrogenase, partial [Actinobacteria bacterium]|nr:3-hydroxybutyryl-CoA dehydrogenase [Actinomycetota bacterium]
MAVGIAEVVARSGMHAVVRARSADSASSALKQLEKGLARQVEKGKLEAAERDAIVSRVSTCTDLTALADCDIVIETVVEELATKQQLFRDLDAIVAPATILATNTSTLPVVEMARVTNRPDKVCGIHFFNPA